MAKKLYIEDGETLPAIIIQDAATAAPSGFTESTTVTSFYTYGVENGMTRQEVLAEAMIIITDWATHDAGEKALVITDIEQNHFVAEIPQPVIDDLTAPYKGFKIFNTTTSKPNWWDGTAWVTFYETPTPVWYPTAITLGDFLSNGASLFLNSGAGLFAQFDSTSDDELVTNVSLDRNGIAYDGSAVDFEIYWMKAGATGGTVGWELDYAWISLGDDAYTTADGTITNFVDVTALTDQTLTSTILSIPAGAVGAKTLQLTLRRNSTGAGADTYSGNVEVYGLNLEK